MLSAAHLRHRLHRHFAGLPWPGLVGNSALMNVEPVFALVVATVVWLGLRRQR
jgi:hypothetical protein